MIAGTGLHDRRLATTQRDHGACADDRHHGNDRDQRPTPPPVVEAGEPPRPSAAEIDSRILATPPEGAGASCPRPADVAGPQISGKLLPGASADWQIVLPDGTALGDVCHTLQTDRGDLLYVQSRGVRHGSPDVLARLGRGEEVDASEYTFRTATQIETAAPDLDWLNKGVFISVGGRQATGVVYETYLVQ